jgi:hypothetical protein
MKRSTVGPRLVSGGWLGLLGFLGYLKSIYEPMWMLHLMFLCFALFLLSLHPRLRQGPAPGYGEGPRTQDPATKIMSLPLVRPPSAWGVF